MIVMLDAARDTICHERVIFWQTGLAARTLTLSDRIPYAPGWPGIEPRWTSSAKTGVGTALNLHSRVWFTLSHGILNEIYFPRVDQACIRDLGLIVTNGRDFFSEEKRHCTFQNLPLEPGVPAYELTNTCMQGRYRIEKEVLTDPWRNVVLQKIRFVPLRGTLGDYRLYALLASHLANFGYGNTGWVGDYKGTPMLFAQRDSCALALACSAPWLKRLVGFAGPAPATPEDTPWRALVPAFLVGELRRAFEMGFLLFLPFMVIDMVVASVLMSLGMMMLPPSVVSLPFKLIFFVLVDGWRLVSGSLVQSFGGTGP